jgi:hypothetical protein
VCSVGHVKNHMLVMLYRYKDVYITTEKQDFSSCQKCVVSHVLGAVTVQFIYMYLISRGRFRMIYPCKERFLAVKVSTD